MELFNNPWLKRAAEYTLRENSFSEVFFRLVRDFKPKTSKISRLNCLFPFQHNHDKKIIEALQSSILNDFSSEVEIRRNFLKTLDAVLDDKNPSLELEQLLVSFLFCTCSPREVRAYENIVHVMGFLPWCPTGKKGVEREVEKLLGVLAQDAIDTSSGPYRQMWSNDKRIKKAEEMNETIKNTLKNCELYGKTLPPWNPHRKLLFDHILSHIHSKTNVREVRQVALDAILHFMDHIEFDETASGICVAEKIAKHYLRFPDKFSNDVILNYGKYFKKHIFLHFDRLEQEFLTSDFSKFIFPGLLKGSFVSLLDSVELNKILEKILILFPKSNNECDGIHSRGYKPSFNPEKCGSLEDHFLREHLFIYSDFRGDDDKYHTLFLQTLRADQFSHISPDLLKQIWYKYMENYFMYGSPLDLSGWMKVNEIVDCHYDRQQLISLLNKKIFHLYNDKWPDTNEMNRYINHLFTVPELNKNEKKELVDIYLPLLLNKSELFYAINENNVDLILSFAREFPDYEIICRNFFDNEMTRIMERYRGGYINEIRRALIFANYLETDQADKIMTMLFAGAPTISPGSIWFTWGRHGSISCWIKEAIKLVHHVTEACLKNSIDKAIKLWSCFSRRDCEDSHALRQFLLECSHYSYRHLDILSLVIRNFDSLDSQEILSDSKQLILKCNAEEMESALIIIFNALSDPNNFSEENKEKFPEFATELLSIIFQNRDGKSKKILARIVRSLIDLSENMEYSGTIEKMLMDFMHQCSIEDDFIALLPAQIDRGVARLIRGYC